MKTLLIFILSIFIVPSITSAQSGFYKNYDYEGVVHNIVKTSDNGLVLLIQSAPSKIVKIDTMGNVKWSTYFTCSTFDHVQDITETSDTCYVALISIFADGLLKIGAVKVDRNGKPCFTRMYQAPGSNTAWSISSTADKGFIMIGAGCNGGDFAIRCDSKGDIVWQKNFGYNRDASCGIKNRNGDYVVAGQYYNSEFIRLGYYLNLFDVEGNLIWSKQYAFTDSTVLKASYSFDPDMYLRETKDGYVILSSVLRKPVIFKVDKAGNWLWTKSYDFTETQTIGRNIVPAGDDGFMVIGNVYYDDIRNVQILNYKTDQNGDVEWARSIGNRGDDDAFGLEKINGSYFIGMAFDGASVIKADVHGNGFCSNYDLLTSTVRNYEIEQSTVSIDSSYNTDFLVIDQKMELGSDTYEAVTMDCQANITTNNVAPQMQEEVKIYPNPSSGTFYISAAGRMPAIDAVSIYDSFGRKVMEQELSDPGGAIEIELPGATGGLYYCRLYKNKTLVNTYKVVVR